MATYSIKFTGFENLSAIALLQLNAVMPVIDQAVRMTAEKIQHDWQSQVWKAKLWLPEKQKYFESIKWQSTGIAQAIISSDYDKAGLYENKIPERDLKKNLQTSNKVRVVKNGKNAGKKYLIIPFRHNTPGMTAHAKAMPLSIYAKAKQLTPSSITGQTIRLSGTGVNVPQLTYKWGGRLQAGLAPKLQPHHKTDIYAGMVKMNTSTPSGKNPGQKSSAYLTFRVMSESSTGWIVPEKPGLYVVKSIAQTAQKDLDDAVSSAVSFALGKS